MKWYLSLTASILSFYLLMSCQTKTSNLLDNQNETVQNSTQKKEIPAARLQTAQFTITGMTCAIGCAQTIQNELNSLDGVQKATVNFDKKQASVTFDKTALTTAKLTKVVEATADGKTYKVSKIKI